MVRFVLYMQFYIQVYNKELDLVFVLHSICYKSLIMDGLGQAKEDFKECQQVIKVKVLSEIKESNEDRIGRTGKRF